ncbi:MAG: sodium:calcium antiporter [Chloroflexota bacterium]|nr:sodium:calcium antiporter [Chloroflexota bacterium]MDE2896219.1 sodium:calcium antiporter [Chloroflexota bacterium]
MAVLWLQFVASAVLILLAAHFLASSADTVADRTGLGRSFIGVVMLATATSLPELATGISSIAWLDAPDLAIGDAFGSNLFNLMIIGLADLYWQNGPVLNAVTRTSVMVGALGAGLIGLATLAIFIYSETDLTDDWYLSPFTILLMLGFVAAMYLIYRHSQQTQDAPGVDEPEEQAKPDVRRQSLSRALTIYAISAAVVVASAVWLADVGEQIAETMHWAESFVGTQFLAISTSLPEIGTSFAALRLNAPDLAITNVLGSNVFNMGIVLFFDDIAFTDGAVWSAVSTVHIISGMIALLMTMVVIVGIMTRPRKRVGNLWTPEGALLVGGYGGASALLFLLA